MQAIGIDIGGTNIKGVLIDENGILIHEVICDTNEKESDKWKNSIADIFQELKGKSNAESIPVGLCAPGLAAADNSSIALMPGRLSGLEHFAWSEWLKTPTWVVNDAHAALMAEAKFGAGRGYQDIIMLTLGTGVGGGIMIKGELHQGLLSRAGHLGHVTMNADSDEPDITQMPASLEDAIGNSTVAKRSLGRYTSTVQLVEAYKARDTFATYIWLHSIKRLAVGLCTFINIVSPQIIILGGGIAQSGTSLFQPLDVFMDTFEWRYAGIRTPIVRAAFEEYSGAAGAAGFAMHKTLIH